MGIAHRKAPTRPGKTSTADALFSKVRQRVLGVLYGNTERTYFANEIIKLAASGSGAVQRELARLVSAGLLTARRVGNQRHYQANRTAPVFVELRTLVLKTSGLADQLRDALAPHTSRIRAAFVYGSVAKNEDTATSDVDLMVISDDLTHADLFLLLEEASRALGRTVNPTVYSTAELEKRVARRNAFVVRVLAQPKIWLIGSEDDLTA